MSLKEIRVYGLDLKHIKTFRCAVDAEAITLVSRKTIGTVLRGVKYSADGLVFCYAHDDWVEIMGEMDRSKAYHRAYGKFMEKVVANTQAKADKEGDLNYRISRIMLENHLDADLNHRLAVEIQVRSGLDPYLMPDIRMQKEDNGDYRLRFRIRDNLAEVMQKYQTEKQTRNYLQWLDDFPIRMMKIRRRKGKYFILDASATTIYASGYSLSDVIITENGMYKYGQMNQIMDAFNGRLDDLTKEYIYIDIDKVNDLGERPDIFRQIIGTARGWAKLA